MNVLLPYLFFFFFLQHIYEDWCTIKEMLIIGPIPCESINIAQIPIYHGSVVFFFFLVHWGLKNWTNIIEVPIALSYNYDMNSGS